MKTVRYHLYGDSDVLVFEERRPLADLAAVHDQPPTDSCPERPS